jgi:hypothetical protein
MDRAGGDGRWHEAAPVGHISDAAKQIATVEGGPRGGGPGSIIEAEFSHGFNTSYGMCVTSRAGSQNW